MGKYLGIGQKQWTKKLESLKPQPRKFRVQGSVTSGPCTVSNGLYMFLSPDLPSNILPFSWSPGSYRVRPDIPYFECHLEYSYINNFVIKPKKKDFRCRWRLNFWHAADSSPKDKRFLAFLNDFLLAHGGLMGDGILNIC